MEDVEKGRIMSRIVGNCARDLVCACVSLLLETLQSINITLGQLSSSCYDDDDEP